MMQLTVHNLAKTYKLLPSEVLAKATTFDLYILDLSAKHIKYQQELEESKRGGVAKPKAPPKLTQEQMQAMINRVKNKAKK